MTQTSKADRARIRAVRLRNEAHNCLSLAIAARDAAFSAELIDEALRLTRCSDELVA